MFDYISIILIVILAIGALIGFFKGSLKMLGRFVVFGIAIVCAIFFCKPIANAMASSGMGKGINDWLYGYIANKIDFQVGSYHITGDFEVTESMISLINTAGRIGDESFNIWHSIYAKLSIPQGLYGTIDGSIANLTASYDSSFTLARPLSDVLTNGMCLVLSFLILFLGILLVGHIALALIKIIGKILGAKPSLLSRLLGMATGLIIAAGTVWALCLTMNIVMMMDNQIADHIKNAIKVNEPDTWTFAKWLCQAKLGYNEVIAFLMK